MQGVGPQAPVGRVTMAEIADAAGVSVPTVSRVVNGRGEVSPGTRRRVEFLLHQHGYLKRNTSSSRALARPVVFRLR